jgi:MSHA biogenesis protein MshQ
VNTETWNGTTFVSNTLDNCSDDLSEWTGFFLSNYSGNLNSGESTSSFAGLISGSGLLSLSAPGAGNDGSVRISLDGPDWLQYDYDADGSAEDVRATANFGIWPGRDPVILIRETYRN